MAIKFELQANHAATAWTDITSSVDVETFRVGGRASNGESEQQGFNLDDDAAAIALPAHRIVRVTETATTPDTIIGWGRIQSVDIGRGKMPIGDARAFDVQLTDANGELRGISFDHLTRPAETPSERMRAALQEFCNGVWRPSTVLERGTYVPLLSFDDMPKKRYPTGKLEDILSDIAQTHNLLYFVTNDMEAFLAQQTSTIYQSTIAISDDPGDIDYVTVFPPIFDGPGNSTDGDQVSSAIRMQYGNGKTVFIRRSAVEIAYDRWEDVQSLDTPNKGFATNRANSTLDRHGVEESTIRCKLVFNADQVDLVKHGQTLSFRAAAAGILSPLTFRIASLIWEFGGPGTYVATLELNFPLKVAGTIDHTPPGPPLPPFVPGPTKGYIPVVLADGALHAWKYDEASGDAIDYASDLDLSIVVTGTNPTRQVSGPPAIIGSKAFELTTAFNGLVTAVAPNDGADFPSGNASYTLEWHGDYIATFLDSAFIAHWGNLRQTHIEIGGSPTSLTLIVSGVSISTTSGSLDVSAFTGAGYHNFMLTYDGPTRAYVLYIDGLSRWAGTGNVDADTDQPSAAGDTVLFLWMALQTFRFGWQSLYVSALTAGQAANHALGDEAVIPGDDQTVPLPGQPVAPESAVSNGTRTVYTTSYPYAPGSLVVKVNGNIVVVEETDPEAGVFTLATPPSPRAVISWTYLATGEDATGASNPPPPSSTPATPGDPGQVIGGDGVARLPSQPYIPAEAPDGSIVVFTIVPYVAGQATQLDIGTQSQRKGIDWWELDPAAGTVQLDEAPITDEEITVWAMPLVGTPPTSSESVAGLYGSGLNGDSKANIQMGPQGDVAILYTAGVSDDLDSILIQARGGPVYSGGTGGAYDVDLYAADATGRPTGSILAHTTYTPGNPGGAWTSYDTITWSSPETTVLGDRYCAVFTNTDGAPNTNYISLNCLFVFGAALLPRQPLFLDTGFGVLTDTGSGFVFHRQGGDFTPNVDLAYAGGHHDGQGYTQNMETTTYSGGTHVPGIASGSSDLVREHVTVSGGDRRVVDVHVRARLNSGSAPLIAKLKHGATVLGSVSIPASAFSPATAPYNDDGGSKWGAASFVSTLTIVDGETYDVEFSCAAGTSYSFAPIRKGTDEGFDPSLVFMDGQGEFTTNGGSSWAVLYPFDTDAPNLQLYMRVTT